VAVMFLVACRQGLTESYYRIACDIARLPQWSSYSGWGTIFGAFCGKPHSGALILGTMKASPLLT
jgi:hypothetical protein